MRSDWDEREFMTAIEHRNFRRGVQCLIRGADLLGLSDREVLDTVPRGALVRYFRGVQPKPRKPKVKLAAQSEQRLPGRFMLRAMKETVCRMPYDKERYGNDAGVTYAMAHKITVIKAVRASGTRLNVEGGAYASYNIGLREAKDFVEGTGTLTLNSEELARFDHMFGDALVRLAD